MRFARHAFTYLFTVFLANAIAVYAQVSVVGNMIYYHYTREIYQKLVLDNPLNYFLVNWVLFPVVFFILLYYIWPIRVLYRNQSGNELKRLNQKAIRHVLNAPIVLSSFGIAAWLIGIVILHTIYIIEGVRFKDLYLFSNLINTAILGSIVFVISFYIIDLFNRRIFIPRLIPGSTLLDLAPGFSIGLRFRLEVFIVAVSIGPILILMQVALNLSMTDEKIPALRPAYIIALAICLMLISISLSALLARFLRMPIQRMRIAVQEIEKSNYDIQLPVISRDEIGQLASGINSMAIGLAEKERIKDTFGRVVDPRVRDHLLSNPVDPGGQSCEVTVLFSDIRGFTNFSEGRDPQAVVSWLNAFFEEMASAIEMHGGLVNKYIGDAILAVFNAPLPVEHHSTKALQAAKEMQARLLKLNGQLKKQDQPEIEIGIGIDRGLVMAGNIGSRNRMEYTVIGDVVNTASRVEGLCKKLTTNLLFTQSVSDALIAESKTISDSENHTEEISSLESKYVSQVRVRGKDQVLALYTL